MLEQCLQSNKRKNLAYWVLQAVQQEAGPGDKSFTSDKAPLMALLWKSDVGETPKKEKLLLCKAKRLSFTFSFQSVMLAFVLRASGGSMTVWLLITWVQEFFNDGDCLLPFHLLEVF